jgi:hypothetical protein
LVYVEWLARDTHLVVNLGFVWWFYLRGTCGWSARNKEIIISSVFSILPV